jgi:WhiB family redox-sensing transcriptional regulator
MNRQHDEPLFRGGGKPVLQARNILAPSLMTQVQELRSPEMDWVVDAPCSNTDPEVFFPDRGDPLGKIARARAVCDGCEIREQCLEYALSADPVDDWGIWAGTTKDERVAIRKERARGLAA